MPKPTTVESVLRLARDTLYQPQAETIRYIANGPQDLGGTRTVHPYPLTLPAACTPFHFTGHLTRLCEDICERMPEFTHVDMDRVLVTFARCRNDRRSGLQAKLVPLRFRNGERTQMRRGREYRVQQFFVDDVELLYVLSFYLPRFLNQSFDEKMVTVFHELFHICPRFSGDVRRFAGTRSVHNRSQREYDREMASYARAYLSGNPPRERVDFLRLSFADLKRVYGDIVGLHLPAPKLIPMPSPRKGAARNQRG